MLSRTAEALFWIGRYIERAEYTARYTNVHYHLLLGSDALEDHAATWRRYLDSTRQLGPYEHVHGQVSTHSVVEFLTLDKLNPNSIVRLISAARDNARSIQDQLSSEVWHQINTFYLSLEGCTPEDLWQGPHQLLYRVQHTCYTLYGVLGNTMMHDEGWCFYRLGQNIERASHTARLLAHPILLKGASEPTALSEFHQCLAILKSASAYEAYRKTCRSDLVPAKIVQFLLLHERFPRSVRFCAGTTRQLLTRLMSKPSSPDCRETARLIGQLAADLEYATVEESYRMGLATFLADVVERLDEGTNAMARTFFHAGEPLEAALSQQRHPRRPVLHLREPTLQATKALISVEHQFTYRYDSPVSSVRTLMRPAPPLHYGRQRRLDIRWHIEPPADNRHYSDAFGNLVWQLDHAHVEKTISSLAQIRVETTAFYVTDGVLALQGVGLQDTDCTVEPAEFTRLTHLVDSSEALLGLAQHLRNRGAPPAELAESILNQVHAHMCYASGPTHVGTPASEAYGMASGVCQDYAHVMLAVCRQAGLPARYVSGYLPGEGQMHAWVEVLLPVAEQNEPLWVAYDPTHQRRCDERYVTVAIGRDYQDIAPTSGYYSGKAKNTLEVKVSVVMESQGPAEHWFPSPTRSQNSPLYGDASQQQ